MFDLQLLSLCGSMYHCLSRSVPDMLLERKASSDQQQQYPDVDSMVFDSWKQSEGMRAQYLERSSFPYLLLALHVHIDIKNSMHPFATRIIPSM